MKIKTILQSLLFAYAMTGIFLFILAFMVYKFEWEEIHVTAGILIIYVLASLLGGRMSGKIARKNRLPAGALTGLGYFLLLVIVSCAVRGAMEMTVPYLFTTFAMCLGGGLLGGILS
ncbi:MAG: TIGR04086 family membrane protein [Lachnospiraceae bacterium]|nr:TIGR04086 family membrane protein [Lachnospiraceae bacterium]